MNLSHDQGHRPTTILTYLTLSVISGCVWWGAFLLGNMFETTPGISACYPAAGITLAFGLVFGWRYIPCLLFGIMAYDLIVWSPNVLNSSLQNLRHIIIYYGFGLKYVNNMGLCKQYWV